MLLSELAELVNPPGVVVGNSEGVVALTAAAATNYLLHQIPDGRTGQIRRLVMRNAPAASGGVDTAVILGETDTGAASGVFTAKYPPITVEAGQTVLLELPEIEDSGFDSVGNILAQLETASAGGGVKVRFDVEEQGA